MDDCRLAVRSDGHSLLAVHMCKSNRRTTANVGKQIWETFSSVGNVASAKCRYFKLVKRLCIDKSLSSQESCCAKTALEAAPAEKFLFLLQ